MAAPVREPSFDILGDFRDRVPSLVLHELVDGEYQPVVAATAGSTFAMADPFEFFLEPAELLDEEG